MITINNNTIQIILTEQDRYFVDLVANRITAYGQIPYSVPEKLIVEIIRESSRSFYRWGYYRSQQKMFYRLPLSEILRFTSAATSSNGMITPIATDDDFMSINPNADNFQGHIVPLPGFVNNVMEVNDISDQSTAAVDDFKSESALYDSTSYMKQGSIRGINQSLFILERTAKIIEQQAITSIYKSAVPFNYNSATRKLLIHKKVKNTLVLETICNVDIQYLYNDDLFIRHVIARTKQELQRIIGGHTVELPNGATLNAEAICNNLEDVEKVEDILKASSGVGDIIMSRD